MSTAVLPLSSSVLSFGKGFTLSAQVELLEDHGREINMQQVGEEVEGIVMLSLLKQKMEILTEHLLSPRLSPRMSISDEDDSDAMEAGSPTMKRKSSILEHSSKRQRPSSPEKPWMEMFGLVKKHNAAKDKALPRVRDAEGVAMQEWLHRQMAQHSCGSLSQERVELLRMIGVELPSDQESHSLSDDSHNSEEDEFEESNDSGKEAHEPQRTLRVRKMPQSIPPVLITNSESRRPRKIGGKRKANLKRNSLHNWVYNQRRLQYEGNLPSHRKKLLDKIGFDWKWVQQKIDEQATQPEPLPKPEEEDEMDVPNSKSEELWHTRYRELIEFKQVHGHYEVPRYVE